MGDLRRRLVERGYAHVRDRGHQQAGRDSRRAIVALDDSDLSALRRQGQRQYERGLRLSELDYIATSEAAQRSIAEQYVQLSDMAD